MSLKNDGISCALCHAYLFEEDDVVYCPVCGAPHHRDCYNSIGKCAVEELHGTENQYDKLRRAAEEQKAAAEAEEKQTTETDFQTPFGTLSPIDFLGGVKPEEEISEGVTAREAAKFVLSNTMRYIPKFKKLNKNNKVSWNFLAFLFPCGWFLSRKMYLKGIIAGVIQLVSSLLMVPLSNTLYSLGIAPMTYQAESIQRLAVNMDKIPQSLIYVAFLGSCVSLAVSILSGLFGDYLYKKHVVTNIKDIKKNSEQKDIDFRKKGGVNIYWFILSLFVLQYLPSIIANLI